MIEFPGEQHDRGCLGSRSSRSSIGGHDAQVSLKTALHTLTNFSSIRLRWLKQSGLDTPSMAHLKRIRKIDATMSMVLCMTREQPRPPTFPESIALPPPYVVTVPKTAALTMTSLKLKSSLWPTIYAPRKKFEPEPWSRGKVNWACEAMRQVIKQAREAGEKGEVRSSSREKFHQIFISYRYP